MIQFKYFINLHHNFNTYGRQQENTFRNFRKEDPIADFRCAVGTSGAVCRWRNL